MSKRIAVIVGILLIAPSALLCYGVFASMSGRTPLYDYNILRSWGELILAFLFAVVALPFGLWMLIKGLIWRKPRA